ncbi:alpha/beta hydrolase [Microbacterium marinum]|uniref:alpha/beta hydrolase n=1 Tax=Microbacterium marinum TaxID=421115 RepID=UPI00384B6CFC
MTAERRRPRSRARRVVSFAVLTVVGLLVAGVVGIVIWSQVGVMDAEAGAWDEVRQDDRIAISDTGGNVVLSRAEGESEIGLVFVPGAKVQAEAYAAKLSELVTEGAMAVVITRPWLNLAFFDPRPLSAFTDAVPDVDTWLVGGHSLGGVRACQLSGDADGLVLFASYCSNDVSDSGLPVLSISGSEDGLSTPEKIRDAAPLLPADAEFVEVPGAAHASFGDYGPQAGDGTPSIEDADMTAEITASVAGLLPRL